MKKKVVPILLQEVKVKVDIVTSDDIKIYYTGKFQDFTARYIIKIFICVCDHTKHTLYLILPLHWLSVPEYLLNPFPNKTCFLRVCSTSLLKTLWEKEKLLVTSNFSLFHSVFYSFGETSAMFIKFEIVVCNLSEFGRV